MHIYDSSTALGVITATLTDGAGNIKEQFTKPNLIVQVGKNFLATAVTTASASPFTYVAVGTNSTAATLADTILGTELTRVAFSSSVTTNTATITATFGAGFGTGALTEAGIFNNAVLGTMLSHVIFSVINKAVADTLTISWTITVG